MKASLTEWIISSLKYYSVWIQCAWILHYFPWWRKRKKVRKPLHYYLKKDEEEMKKWEKMSFFLLFCRLKTCTIYAFFKARNSFPEREKTWMRFGHRLTRWSFFTSVTHWAFWADLEGFKIHQKSAKLTAKTDKLGLEIRDRMKEDHCVCHKEPN